MHILVSNDDGIESPGIEALASALGELGTVWVVAPDSERSAQSHALTMHKPLRATEVAPRRWAVSGTPADCVYLAIHHLLPERPAIVASGINNGSNLGNDVFYSGTVAAAMEGAMLGVPALAISLHRHLPGVERHWAGAGAIAQRVVREMRDATDLPRRILMNVNVPNVPEGQIKGLKAAKLGERLYTARVDERTDPRGKAYYWIGGDHEEFAAIEGSDGPAVEDGWATITPIVPDLTHHAYLPAVRRWTDG
jgi:5'-nucleotidase